MMYRGSLSWNELTPRMRTVLRAPGEPLELTVTPGTRPSSRCSTLADVCLSTFSRLGEETAPVMSARRWLVYPVTTTSCSIVGACSSATSIVAWPFTGCSLPR